MSIRAGEKARLTGEFRCEKCKEEIYITSGHRIPKCPNCGHDEFDLLANE
jgi:Zn finger protein HypA/HybF involved in hydrogenase expression